MSEQEAYSINLFQFSLFVTHYIPEYLLNSGLMFNSTSM